MKKVLCTLLTVCLMLTAFSVCASAYSWEETEKLFEKWIDIGEQTGMTDKEVDDAFGKELAEIIAAENNAKRAPYEAEVLAQLAQLAENGKSIEDVFVVYAFSYTENGETHEWYWIDNAETAREDIQVKVGFNEPVSMALPEDARLISQSEWNEWLGEDPEQQEERFVRFYVNQKVNGFAHVLLTVFWSSYSIGGESAKGDINQDGTRNLKDLLILRKAIVTETESTFVNADINGDSKVNLSDVLCLRILLAGGPYWSTF